MTATVTREQYEAAFAAECGRDYPAVDVFEARHGYAVDRARLEAAARVLACPVKANPPCWQHGRVLYTAARAYLDKQLGPVQMLDVGTAKGFSALVLRWALTDAGVTGHVDSVDVIDPIAQDYRNSVLEVDGPKRLGDYLRPWQEASAIRFFQSTGIAWLQRSTERVHVAFIDGKHSGDVVATEAKLLATRQRPGDLVVFDDVHIPDVWAAVQGMSRAYTLERLQVLPKRAYAIGVRR